MSLEWLTQWLPSITIGQALVLLVAIDLAILFVVSWKYLMKGGKSNPKHQASHSTLPPHPPPTERVYYDLEETTDESDDDMKTVAEALKHLNKKLPTFPEPPLNGTPAYLEGMVRKAKNPNLFGLNDVKIDTTLPLEGRVKEVDPTLKTMGHQGDSSKKKQRDGFVV